MPHHTDHILISLTELLLQKHCMITTAESCTGGLIAAQLTERPGSSAWFERGFVTYSNLSKQQLLGVPEDLITQAGAVSEDVACAMAEGALTHSAADAALAVTGIAGPEGGTPEKPVGTVCFAVSGKYLTTQTQTLLLKGSNREDIRQQAAEAALLMMFNYLKNLNIHSPQC